SYTTAVREKLYAEGYLVDGLRNEHLSAKAREQRDVILFGFRQVKARFDQHDAGFGQDSSDENQSWSLAPSMTSDASLPSDFQDDGKSLMAEVSVFYSFAVLFFPEHSFFGSEWQKRWCVLNRRTFYYYANEKSKQPKGNFSIEHYSARLAFHLRKDSRKRCCFELICPGKRTYEFTAPSPAEAEDWVDQIQFLLKDLSSLTIPYDEEDDEELYNDVDSSDSVNTTSHNTALNQDEPNVEGEDNDIYEVLPGEKPKAEPSPSLSPANAAGDLAEFMQESWDGSSGSHRARSWQVGRIEYNMYGWWVGELNNVVGIVPKDYLVAAYDLEE
uniref:Src kinase associated phosphoprotein 1 n=1 Tax=Athene cunicularia TaxID=194338 RepID=A0A663MRJ9_ATHCN